MSRFGVDFLVWRASPAEEWKIAALEINLRMGGTTHPYLALQFLTGGQLDPATGLFLSPSGHTKYYRATDNLHGERYRGLLPEDLIEILTVNKLHYSHATERGVLFHLIGALSQFGKVGLTAIAQQPGGGGRALPAHDHRPRPRGGAGAAGDPRPGAVRPHLSRGPRAPTSCARSCRRRRAASASSGPSRRPPGRLWRRRRPWR